MSPEPIKPIYTTLDPRTNEPIFGLSFADFTRIERGYGCPHCLATFDHAEWGKCPDCKREMNDNAVAPKPADW
jgi:hypothetical protein